MLAQVFMLALDTLQWSTLIPHPLSLTAPAIHGHTAVEDPSNGDRIIVFGGRGGAHWKMEVHETSRRGGGDVDGIPPLWRANETKGCV